MIPIISVFVLVNIDQIIKLLTVKNLKNHVGEVVFIPHLIDLIYVENRGAAFGIFAGQKILLTVLPIFIIIGLTYYYTKLTKSLSDKLTKVSIVLIISGAIGNLIDRIFKGYVVDMFHFSFFEFPVFNFADILVVTGAILIIISTFIAEKETKENE